MKLSLNTDNFFTKIVDKFKTGILSAVEDLFMSGSKKIAVEFGGKPKKPSKKELDLLNSQVNDYITGVTDEMSKQIRTTIREGQLARKSPKEIAEDLDGIFKGENPTRFDYKKRLQMIARTESTRIQEFGTYSTAKDLGASMKYLDVLEDERTSDICGAMHSKYGSKEQAIPINEEFEVSVNGKVYGGKLPPFHVNCRTSVRYEFE